MRKTFTAAAMAALAMPAVAHADDTRGVYIAANVGSASMNDVELQYYEDGDELDTRGDVKSALAYGGAIGYDFGLIRAEIEGSYARHKVKSLTVTGLNGTAFGDLDDETQFEVCDYLEVDSCPTSGQFGTDGVKIRQAYGLANLWVDVPVGDTIAPYVGGGIGIGGYEVDGEGKGKMAWQLGAGVAFRITGKTYITADYRHRQIGDTTIVWDEASGINVSKIKSDVFGVGARVGF